MTQHDHMTNPNELREMRRKTALAAQQSCGDPSRELTVIGVTGTNGKTTMTYLLESIFQAAGMRAGVIGTVEYRIAARREEASHTTPPPTALAKLLRTMVDEKVKACVMEVSSHALDQQRVAGLHFDGAIFTNLTPDHLDYHHDMETYFAAKTRLFTEHLPQSSKKQPFAVIGIDDPYGQRLAKLTSGKVWRYGLSAGADVTCHVCDETSQGLALTVVTPEGELRLRSPLIGRFNVSNIMAAVATATLLRLDAATIAAGIAQLDSVPGRLERVDNTRGVQAFVDYAHTPDALERVLQEARRLARSRVVVVFGCGGDRDRLKRPLMGEIAARLADVAIVTSDNPRSEDPDAIIAEIRSSMGKKGIVLPDRREAIARAVEEAQHGDVLIVAGKGHEQVQIVGNERHHFDDREELKRCFN